MKLVSSTTYGDDPAEEYGFRVSCVRKSGWHTHLRPLNNGMLPTT